ncbi:hypothetical protein RSP03_32390 [Cereibacter sphaeroides]|nr:hypothetical protein RSP03_32390 [Cereibacter sphaeroides]
MHWAAPWVAAPPPAVGSESLFSGGDERQESLTTSASASPGAGCQGLAPVGKQRRPGLVAMPDGGARVSGTARGLKERAFLW